MDRKDAFTENQITVSTWKFALGATAIAFALIAFVGAMLRQKGIPINMGIAMVTALLVRMWFEKSVGRIPTFQERTAFLWKYSGLMLVLIGQHAIYRITTEGLSLVGLFIIFLQYVSYPLFALAFFTGKNR